MSALQKSSKACQPHDSNGHHQVVSGRPRFRLHPETPSFAALYDAKATPPWLMATPMPRAGPTLTTIGPSLAVRKKLVNEGDAHGQRRRSRCPATWIRHTG